MSIETIKERAEAATPGDSAHVIRADGAGLWGDPYGGWLVWTDRRTYIGDIYHESDAAFIAHARTDIPALLRVAEAARSLVEQEGDCDPMGLGCRHISCPWPDLRAALADLEALP